MSRKRIFFQGFWSLHFYIEPIVQEINYIRVLKVWKFMRTAKRRGGAPQKCIATTNTLKTL